MMPAGVNVVRRNIAQTFVITPIVVVFDKGPNRLLQFTWHIVKDLVNFSFKGAVVSLNLAVSLGMEGRGSNVSDSYQAQILVELLG